VCTSCWLLQIPSTLGNELGSAAWQHGHGSSFSSTVQGYARTWVEELMTQVALKPGARVLDVSSNDGYLLQPFAERGMRVLGLERNGAIAADASVPTRVTAFGSDVACELAASGWRSDLVLVNHALGHAEDLDQFVAGLAHVLAPHGAIAIAFHDAQEVVAGGQFDVICHAHRCYLTLSALDTALRRHGLRITTASRSALHGGSVCAVARWASEDHAVVDAVAQITEEECARQLNTLEGYACMAEQAASVKAGLLDFLASARADGCSVVGYSAPSRGTTLLNYCGIGAESLPFVVDRAPDKQGRCLPGCRIPIRAPAELVAAKPDYVLILAWPLAPEVMAQLSMVREWGGRFVVAVPEFRILN
jgi:hypothetical protein